jgi:hypothetical protein
MRSGVVGPLETDAPLDAKTLRKLGCVVHLLGSPTTHSTGAQDSMLFILLSCVESWRLFARARLIRALGCPRIVSHK